MNGDFSEKLLLWYSQNKRHLPWRGTQNPYKIWISEVILQQTRVRQGVVYYEHFLEAFPDIFALAGASARQVYKLWQGLGYYNRADNLMKTAKIITGQYGGRFPEDYETLKTLPGIGDYTAAAIASMAFDKPCAVVDGNVYRVLSRIFALETPIHTSRGKKEFNLLARKLMGDSPPAGFNQALMEFGALQCLPDHPDCQTCIFHDQCLARASERQSDFPVKKKKNPAGRRFYYYFVIRFESRGETFFYLKKRSRRDIWRNLYTFPDIEMPFALENPMDILTMAEKDHFFGTVPFSAGKPSSLYKQQLTHLSVSAWFIPVFLHEPLNNETKNSLSLVQQNQLINFPVPRITARYLQDNKIIHVKEK